MIDAKTAAQKAAKYLQDIKNVESISLEEIELTDDEKYWMITLSYSSGIILDNREYWKIFKVNSTTGKVISMKSGT